MKITDLCEKLRASVSIKKELKEVVHDLMQRDEILEEALLKKIEANELLEDPHLSIPQKCQQLRWRLHKLRYPHLAQAEERFLQTKKKLSLPETIHLQHSPFFEKKEIKMELKFRSAQEYRELVKKLHAIAEKEDLEDLFL